MTTITALHKNLRCATCSQGVNGEAELLAHVYAEHPAVFPVGAPEPDLFVVEVNVGPCGCGGCEDWSDCDYCDGCSPRP